MAVSVTTMKFCEKSNLHEIKWAYSEDWNSLTTAAAKTKEIRTNTTDSNKNRPTNAKRELPRILRVFTERIRIGT